MSFENSKEDFMSPKFLPTSLPASFLLPGVLNSVVRATLSYSHTPGRVALQGTDMHTLRSLESHGMHPDSWAPPQT